MSRYQILGSPSLPNLSWEECPNTDFKGAPVWRSLKNPIIGRNPIRGVARTG